MDRSTFARTVTAAAVAWLLTFTGSALADPPQITAMPDLAGRAVAPGDVLDGTATVSAGATVTYQWLQCDPNGPACGDIAGETAATYTATALDVGWQLAVRVTADNGDPGGPVVQESGHTATVANHVAPQIDSGPTITGDPIVGHTLTATATATGDPAPTITYAWQRCDTTGANCTPITGATNPTYDLVADDSGHTLRVTATATNATPPDATATSNPTPTVTTAPAIDTGPTITGDPIVGHTLTATATATGDPAPTITYAWQRCDTTGAACTPIAGATNPTYDLVADDSGHTLRVTATATNATPPDATATSNPTPTVTTAPAIDSGPTITGDPIVGHTLTATATATGDPAPTITYAWQRCDTTGAACTPIAGATNPTYDLIADDSGHTLRVTATATNATPPDATATSNPTPTVTSPPPPPPPPTDTKGTDPTPAPVTAATVTPAQTVTPVAQPAQAPATAAPGPFPKIRIRGRLVASGGARITYLAVLATPGWRVTIDCRGRGCPARRATLTTRSATTRLHAYEKVLRPGVRLVVTITRAGVTGKYSSFVIRAHSAPQRHDLCLTSRSSRAVPCSS